MKCKICKKDLSGNQTMYCSKKCSKEGAWWRRFYEPKFSGFGLGKEEWYRIEYTYEDEDRVNVKPFLDYCTKNSSRYL